MLFCRCNYCFAYKSISYDACSDCFTSWSLSVMITSLNDPILNCVGSLSPSNITTCTIERTGFTIYRKKKSQLAL